MLPEPTLPKPAAAAAALGRPWVMTPLFGAPPGLDRDANPRSDGRHAASPSRRAGPRPSPRTAAGRGKRSRGTGTAGPGDDTAALLAVTGDRLRRALSRSFLRHGVTGDMETAVDAAMNVIEPVLQARDTEILRLREVTGRPERIGTGLRARARA
jgi:hypothetical protein